MWVTNSPQIENNLKQHGCVSSSLDHILEAASNRSTCLSNVSLPNWWTSRSGSGLKTVWPKAITLHPSNGKKIQTSNMQRPKRQECRLAHQMGARRPGRPTSGNAELLHAFAGPVPTSDFDWNLSIMHNRWIVASAGPVPTSDLILTASVHFR